MTDDLELLWEYARSGAQSAFATVAERYIDLVYSAALRQVRDPHVAEDVTQAVLIILMNKAGSLEPGTIVPGWLVRTTRYAALDAMKLQRRRRKHEEQAAAMRSETASDNPDEVKWEDVSPMVDEALLTLRRSDRDAIVLRYLLGKSPEEIAWVMHVSEEAARQRVSRALARLREILLRRGITAPENAIGSVLIANAVMRAPTAVSSLAGTIAAPGSGALSAPPAVIARGALRTMQWSKAKWAAGGMLVTACMVVLAVMFWPRPKPPIAKAPDPGGPGARPPRGAGRTPAEIEQQYAKKFKPNPRLGWAAFGNDIQALKQFVAAGDDVNARSRDGQLHTPLIWATLHPRDGGYELVAYLLDHGAGIDAQRVGGTTPLMMATRMRSPQTMKLLLERGADTSIKDATGRTALDIAREMNEPALIKVLEERR
jgi:RNA polymerase sigma factor (sigma-70 family)